ncbi:VOC family protein [Nocardia colli]|uniref:VOC family protein n=1 Tax=Nocardia colli TaxID=2545717 RepID=A0A5N0EFN0_9NOCA|nr:VOC family protein [Nocardia colli]KAA8886221.1 VOC family protein [Nocardia colli]
MRGELTFFEIGLPDSARAQIFYSRLFGWEFPPIEDDGQVWIKTPTIKGGLHDQDAEARIAIYFSVDDIDAAVRTVRELGGTAEDPRPEEPGFGRFTACADDQGVQFGLHQRAAD